MWGFSHFGISGNWKADKILNEAYLPRNALILNLTTSSETGNIIDLTTAKARKKYWTNNLFTNKLGTVNPSIQK